MKLWKRVGSGLLAFTLVLGGVPVSGKAEEAEPSAKEIVAGGYEIDMSDLPHVTFGEHPEWEELFDAAWQTHKANIRKASDKINPEGVYYVDEAFSDMIFAWDTMFMMFFDKYGLQQFPTLNALDNFYYCQTDSNGEDDGFIAREISEKTGENASYNGGYDDPKSLNPPLWAWAEWEQYQIHGDKSRFTKVIKGKTILERIISHFNFVERTRTMENGLYGKTTGLANGFDNTPNQDYGSKEQTYNDLSIQQAQAAYYISKIAAEIGKEEIADKFMAKYEELKTKINDLLWSEEGGFYFNLDKDGNFTNVATPTGLWALAGRVATPERAQTMIRQYALNSEKMYRPNGLSTVAYDYYKSENDCFIPLGEYWKGGVWSPASFQYIKGLDAYGYEDMAFEEAVRHIHMLSDVYEKGKTDPVIGHATFWEYYSSEYTDRGTWRSGSTARDKFVGWTGALAIAGMIEDVLGVNLHAPQNEVSWNLHLTEANGIDNLYMKHEGVENRIALHMAARQSSTSPAKITVTAAQDFTLHVTNAGETVTIPVTAGTNTYDIAGEDGNAGELGMAVHPLMQPDKDGLSDSLAAAEDYVVFTEEEKQVADGLPNQQQKSDLIYNVNTIGCRRASSQNPILLQDNPLLQDAGIAGAKAVVKKGHAYGEEGFMVMAPADNESRMLRLWIGIENAEATVKAAVSDASSARREYIIAGGEGEQDYIVDIPYRAAADGRNLLVEYVIEKGNTKGKVSLKGAALYDGGSCPPDTPGFSVKSGDGQLTVDVKAKSQPDSYKVYFGTQKGIWSDVYETQTMPYTISNLTNYNRYYVSVTAVMDQTESCMGEVLFEIPEEEPRSPRERAQADLDACWNEILGKNSGYDNLVLNLDLKEEGTYYGSRLSYQSSTARRTYGLSDGGAVKRPKKPMEDVAGTLTVTAEYEGETVRASRPFTVKAYGPGDAAGVVEIEGSYSDFTGGTLNLTEEGTKDWAQFGTSSVNSYAKKNTENVITGLRRLSNAGDDRAKDANIYFKAEDSKDIAPADRNVITDRSSGLTGLEIELPYCEKNQIASVYAFAYDAEATVEFYVNGKAYYSGSFSVQGDGSKIGKFDLKYFSADPEDKITVRVIMSRDFKSHSWGGSVGMAAVTLRETDEEIQVPQETYDPELHAAYDNSIPDRLNLSDTGIKDWYLFDCTEDAEAAHKEKENADYISGMVWSGENEYKPRNQEYRTVYSYVDSATGETVQGKKPSLVIFKNGEGIEFSLPGSENRQQVQIYTGTWNSKATVEVTSADKTATASTTVGGSAAYGKYTVDFCSKEGVKIRLYNEKTSHGSGNFSISAIVLKEIYSVKADETEHGSLEIGPIEALPGERIDVLARADAGYVLEEGSLVYETGGETIPISDGWFTMPEGNVTVRASFVKDVMTFEAEDYVDRSGASKVMSDKRASKGKYVGDFSQNCALSYDVNVRTAGNYDVALTVATNQNGGKAQVNSGRFISEETGVPNTGAWQTYTTVHARLWLERGTQRLVVSNIGATWNFDKMTLSYLDSEKDTAKTQAFEEAFLENRWKSQRMAEIDGEVLYINPSDASYQSDRAKWNLIPDEDGCYAIQNVSSGNYLTLEKENGTVTARADGNAAYTGKWEAAAFGGYLVFFNRKYRKCGINLETQSDPHVPATDTTLLKWHSAQWTVRVPAEKHEYTIGSTEITGTEGTASTTYGTDITVEKMGSKRKWNLTKDLSGEPKFTADNMRILEAVYNLSLEESLFNINDGMYGKVFWTGTNWHKVWTRDTAMSVQYSLAWVFPEETKNSIREKIIGGTDSPKVWEEDTGTGGSYPSSVDRIIMEIAGWELYKTTGDKDFLEEIYEVSKNTLEQDYHVAYDSLSGLFKGETGGLDHRSKTYPDWMDENEQDSIINIAESKAANANIIFAQALNIMAQSAKILGKPESEAADWEAKYQDLKKEINDHFWLKDRGMYSSWEYPSYMGSPAADKVDVIANGYALMFDIADDAKKQQIMENYPLVTYGANTVWPQKNGRQASAIYHNRGVWPGWEATMMIGAKENGNLQLADEIFKSCVRGAGMSLTNKEVINFETGQGVHSDRQLWSIAGTLAGYYRVLFGMAYGEDGISFHPYVPDWMEGPFELSNYSYRNAVLNLTVNGKGDTLESITVNGETKPLDYVLPTDAEGTYDIVMNVRDSGKRSKIHLAKDDSWAVCPDLPVLTAAKDGTLTWEENPDYTYKLWDGSKYIDVSGGVYRPASKKVYRVYSLVATAQNGITSEMSKPVVFSPEGTKQVYEAEEAEYNEGNFEAVAKGFTGTGYVIDFLKQKTDLTFTVEASKTGIYQMSLIYNNYGDPTSGQDGGIRSVFVDGKDAGTLIFPIVKYDFQKGPSLFLELEKGTHTITITYNRDDWYDTNMTTARGTPKNSVSYDSLSLQYVESEEAREELERNAAQAKAVLIAYKDANDYRTEQKQELLKEIAAGITAIEEAESTAGVEEALTAAKREIDKIKTDEQLTREEEEAAFAEVKEAAKKALAEYKNADAYRTGQKAELKKAIADGNAAIEAAKDEEEVQAALAAAKRVMDAIKTDAELTLEEAAAALRAAKEAAKTALAQYKDADLYRPAQKQELALQLAAGNTAIEAAKSIEETETALAAAQAAIDKIKTDAELTAEEEAAALKAAKEAAKEALAQYKDADLYRPAQQEELAAAIAAGNTAIETAKSIEETETALAAAKAALDRIKTDAELTAEEEAAKALAQAKEAAKETLASYKAADLYRPSGQFQRARAIAAGNAAIEAAADKEEVEAALAAAKAAIDQIKTDAELTAEEKAEELERTKDTAKASLARYKDAGLYRPAEQEKLAETIASGKEAIASASDAEQVGAALAAAKAAIDRIKTDAQYTEEENASALAAAKKAAKEELAGYKDSSLYRPYQKAKLSAAIAEGKDAIEEAFTIQNVELALETAKNIIDRIKTDAELTAEEAAAALEEAKTAAKAAIAEYKNEYLYRPAEQAELAAAIAAANTAIAAAKDPAGVEAAVKAAQTAIDQIKTDEELSAEETEKALADARKAAKAALAAYKDASLYRPDQKAELAAAIAAGNAAIDAAKDAIGAQKALNAAQLAIDSIPTDEALTAEETAQALKDAKTAAIEALKTYKEKELYRLEQRQEILDAIAAGMLAIDAAETTQEIDTALAAAKAALDQIKTDGQLTVEEAERLLADAKESARKALLAYKDENAYRAEQKAELKRIMEAAAQAIVAAQSPEEAKAQLTAAKKAMDAVKTNADLIKEEQSQIQNPPKPPISELVTNFPAVGVSKKIGKLWYEVLTSGENSRTVKVLKPVKKSYSKVTIPASVEINGYTYKVTAVAAQAFRNNKKLTQVTIGKNVTTIGKQAFAGCAKLKKVTVKSTGLKKVGKNAFAGIDKNAKIVVPQKKLKRYKQLLRDAKVAKSVQIVK